jgi:hypothetical protein
MAGTCTDLQATAIGLIDASANSIIYDSYDTGTGTGSASAVVSPAASGSYAVGGGVALGGTASSLSVSTGAEISGSEVDMGSQTASCGTAAESGGSATITWTYSSVVCTALAATFKPIYAQNISVSDTSTITDTPTVEIITPVSDRSASATSSTTISETLLVNLDPLNLSTQSTTTVSDSITIQSHLNPSVASTSTLADEITTISNLNPSVSSASTLADEILSIGGDGQADTSSITTLADEIMGVGGDGQANLSSTTTITDTPTISFAYAPNNIAVVENGAFTNGYSYKRSITIDNTKVSGTGDLTDFPMLISGTYDGTGGEPDLRVIGSGGKVTNSSGYDIIFTSDSAGTTQLDHEIEQYESTTGRVAFWVRIPTLDGDADTTIYMWYGNSSVSTSQEDINGTWNSGYQGVWHMNDSPAGAIGDSTATPADMTSVGSMGSGDLVDGDFGKAIDFERTNSQYVKTATSVSKLNITGDYTLQGWINLDDYSQDTFILVHGDGAAYYQYSSGIASADGKAFIYSSAGGGVLKSTNAINTGEWYWITAVRSGTTGYIYINNGSPQSGTGFNNPSSRTDALFSGYNVYAPNPYYINGLVGELRVSNTARSSDWIATEYNNLSSPATFYAMGDEVGSTNPTESITIELTTEVTNLSASVVSTSSLTDSITSQASPGVANVSSVSTLSDSITSKASDAQASVQSVSTLTDSITSKSGNAIASVQSVSTVSDHITSKAGDGKAQVTSTSTLNDQVLVNASGDNYALASSVSTLSDSITAKGGAGVVSVSDASTITDAPTVTTVINLLEINTSDSSTISDSLISVGGAGQASVTSTATLSDAIASVSSGDLASTISVSTITDQPTVTLDHWDINVSDTTTVSDSVSLTNAGAINIEIEDGFGPFGGEIETIYMDDSGRLGYKAHKWFHLRL